MKKNENAVPMEKIVGTLPSKNVSLDEAKDYIKITKTEYRSPESLVEKLEGTSHYHQLFDKGADIYPRKLWFVKLIRHGVFGFNPKKPFVVTNEEIGSKPPWDKLRMEGSVEREFLFATVLGDDLIPFGLLGCKPVVLPIVIEKSGGVSLIKGSAEAAGMGYEGLADYLTKVERYWNKLGASKKLGLYDWIDFRKKLTKQRPSAGFKVIYTGSATYLTAAVVDQSQDFSVEVDNYKFKLNGFIAESKTYQYETDDAREADFLVAILNSSVVDNAIKPLQTRGLFGPRDIHKRPLQLPIPQFNKKDGDHIRLAELGKIGRTKVLKEIENLPHGSTGQARSSARKMLADELEKINDLTTKVLTTGKKSNTLLEFLAES